MMRRLLNKRNESGYNLVEVLIAMAILGTVIMSILTLFVFGRRNVYSGRQMTRATSVGTHIIEDLMPLTPAQFYTAFDIDSDTTIDDDNTVAGVVYEDSIIRKAGNFTPGAPRDYFAAWMGLMDADRVTGGDITLVILPRDLGTADDPTTARRVIIRAVTEWREGGRQRQVTLDITKLNRAIF